MSEKRFKIIEHIEPMTIVDFKNGKHYNVEEVVDLLNEQQATIDKLRVDIRATRTTIEHLNNECKGLVSMFEEEVKENEELRKELNDCEKFRYQVFKRIGEVSR